MTTKTLPRTTPPAKPKRAASGAKTSPEPKVLTEPRFRSARGTQPKTPDIATEIRALVRAEMGEASTPDPSNLADAVAATAKSNGAMVDYLVRFALHSIVRHEMRDSRRVSTDTRKAPGRSKWAMVRLSLPALGRGVEVNGEWIWTEDLTADDLEAYAKRQRERAEEINDVADAVERYAVALRACGARTLKEWDERGRPGILDVAA